MNTLHKLMYMGAAIGVVGAGLFFYGTLYRDHRVLGLACVVLGLDFLFLVLGEWWVKKDSEVEI